MELDEKNMFSIGEVAVCCKVDRQTILFYERKGLLHPTLKSESSGYRYYSAEEVTELIQVLRLRDAGLSIREIGDFIANGDEAAQRAIISMEEKMAALKASLEQLRALKAPKGDYSVTLTDLPEQKCFVREYLCRDIDEAMDNMYAAFYEVLRRGFNVRKTYCAYAEYPDEAGGAVKLSDFRLRACIPVALDTADPACVIMPAAKAACVCHRGDYSQIGAAYDALWNFVSENSLTPVAPIRECYLEGRRDYKTKADRFVTQVLLPLR